MLVAVHSGRLYVYDPNGHLIGNKRDSLSPASPHTIRSVFSGIAKAMGKTIDLDSKESYLFRDRHLSQTIATRWMDTEGLCDTFLEGARQDMHNIQYSAYFSLNLLA